MKSEIFFYLIFLHTHNFQKKKKKKLQLEAQVRAQVFFEEIFDYQMDVQTNRRNFQ